MALYECVSSGGTTLPMSAFSSGKILGSYSIPVTNGNEYILIITTSGSGQFNNVKNHIDENKSGFDILDRNVDASPNLFLHIKATASSISSSASGMATTGNNTILIAL